MRRVAEIIYIVENEREAFLQGALHPDLDTQKVLWICGVRKQQYFALNDLIFMTFEYDGDDFPSDMNKMSSYLDGKNMLIKQRRKDVPASDRNKVNWWAPVKRLGQVLETNPGVYSDSNDNLMALLDGSMSDGGSVWNTSYDQDDWVDDFHF